ncbi:MAG: DMT family transporter [Oscillospiraceae bacterium]|nr:DMT family transporter [Oscillospiraceae bacterium]
MQKKTNKLFTNRWFIAVAALLCCALWGSATPFIKIGYELILPERNVPSTILFAGLRFMLAGVLTIIIYSVARKRFLFPQKKNWGKVLHISLFQTVLQYFFFYIGLANTSGVKGTVISGCNVFCSILIASLLFKQEKLTLKKIIACIAGFAGIVIINMNGLDFNMNFLGDGFVFFSTVCYGMSSTLIKIYSKDEDPVVISGYQFAVGGLFMAIVAFIMGGHIELWGLASVGVLVYLAFLSAIAYSLWGVLLKYNPVSKVTVYSFMIPVFGVLLSALMLTEQSNVSAINLVITLILICTGIMLLNYKKSNE